MSIQVSCPNCDRACTVADTQMGKTVRCKGCDEKFVVARAKPSRRDGAGRPRRKKGGPLWVWLAAGGALVVAALVVVAVLVGTAGSRGLRGKVTKENQEKLKPLMTEAEVKAILGEPTDTADPLAPFQGPGNPNRTQDLVGVKTLVWRDGANNIRVMFLDGRVAQVAGEFPGPGEKSAGAAAGLTEENFRRLKQNMTESEVNGILGVPRQTFSNNAYWENGPNHVKATFTNGLLFNATGTFGDKTLNVVEQGHKDGPGVEKTERPPRRKPRDTGKSGPFDLTADNFNKLKGNISEAEARALLGPPTRTRRTATALTLIWEQGKDSVTASFVAGKLNRADAQIDGKSLTVVAGDGFGP